MKAFHTLRVRNKKNFTLADFELFTIILSALEWRKHNGEIKLMTDAAGLNFVKRRGISDIWTEIDSSLDEFANFGIDEDVFWAGAKLLALSKQEPPCVMIDLDFIVWLPINFDTFGENLTVIHREGISPDIYPYKDYFKFKNGWRFPEWLNWSVEPCNGAFVYFGSKNFIKHYCDFAFGFMKNVAPPSNELPYMVFAEQRWMAMCADYLGITIKNFSTLDELFGGRQKYFTHVWGHKQKLRDDGFAAEKFCRDCARRLAHDFPDFAEKISANDWAGRYFD
ncbi:MAG: hypothetical protein K6G55_05880 [Selenomonadaceae bacterium]|nr:hypothetical protein [Selenomonadaceae bacterium]